MALSYTIVSHTCEGLGDCIAVCPVECIHWVDGKTNDKGTKFVYIDASTCIDCGACLSICPIEGAILEDWKPELQISNAISESYSQFDKKWRTDKVKNVAQQVLADDTAQTLPKLADARRKRAVATASCWNTAAKSSQRTTLGGGWRKWYWETDRARVSD